MTETTRLDAAHAAMEAAPDDGAARLRFYERLADGELFLMLAEEAQGENLSPEVFDLSDGRFVLAFDREERLASFAGGRTVPYAALSGRALAHLLAAQGLGLGLNLEVAPSSILIPVEAVAWLAGTLAKAPDEMQAQVAEVAAPAGLPQTLLAALDTKLAAAAGLARAAQLAAVTYVGGGRGHLLAFTGAAPGAEPALAQAVREALVFSGLEAGALDVAFLSENDPLAARLDRTALRFDLPQPVRESAARAAPGSDPARPPILR
ncbi:MAG: SseB family protein [Pseudooceanicola sp.]|nr:SseB family protein [Pseudooceanicola sp.]